ncbi:MAG: YdeI/OmpD-associated family protein [Opitutaceae bacterium]|jgi:hypothetical protein
MSASSSKRFPLSFTSTVVRLETGMRYHALPVPDDVAEKFKTFGTRRLLATINGHVFKRALQNHADGGSFIILGREQLKTCGLKLRSTATVALVPDPTPDLLDMPECFALVLDQDHEARTRWETFPIGRQRSLLHFITSAKQEATQIKRSWELAEKIRTHSLYGDTR